MDAKVVLSALIGGKANRVFAKAKDVKFVTTASVISEVKEYIPVLAKKKGLSENVMRAAFSLLKLEVVSSETYSGQIPAAMIIIGKRDPEDVELVALTLALKCTVWSNDNDLVELEQTKTYTTAEMLRLIDQF